MSGLGWIVLGGVSMSALALSGSLTLLVPERTFPRIVPVLVALAAGTLTGGAMLHLLPEAVDEIGNELSVYVWFLVGFVTVLVLEQGLHWHHCHRSLPNHGPVGYLILIADAVHNFTGGLAFATALLVDVRVGLVTWAAAATHEIPQELGDFGILVHAGWSRRRALVFNVLSGLTFLLGGLVAYALAGRFWVAWLLPFAAGNFFYIAAVDLLPMITGERDGGRKIMLTAAFVVGVAILLGVAIVA